MIHDKRPAAMTLHAPAVPAAGSKPRRQHGFNLLELMIVLAIVGILAAIATPSYQAYVYRAEAAEVILVLDKIRTVLAEVQTERGSLGDRIIIIPNRQSAASGSFVSPSGALALEACNKVSGSTGTATGCEPVAGLTTADLSLDRLGLQLAVRSGIGDAVQAGQYFVTLAWSNPTTAAGRPAQAVVRARQIALATHHVMAPHCYRDIVGSNAANLYFSL